jgi:hypothetical protein
MADDCDIKVKDAFKDRDISKATLDQWLDDAKALKDALDEQFITKAEFNKQMNNMLRERRIGAEGQAMINLRNRQAVKKLREFVTQPGFEGREVEAFHAMLTKSVVMGNESALSVTAKQRGMLGKYTDHIRNGLVESNTFQLAVSGELDGDIAKTMHALNSGKEVPLGVRPEAKIIGQTFFEAQTMALMDIRDAGLPVQFLKNRVTMQTHSTDAIRTAGFDKWAADVVAMKPDTSYLGPKASTPEGLKGILRGMYDDILAGRYGGMAEIQDGEVGTAFGNGRVSNQAIQSRVLNFDPENTVKYMQSYGGTDNIAQAVLLDLTRKSKQTSLFERFGDKPREAYETMIDRTIERLQKEDPKKAEKLSGSRKRLLSEYDQVVGTLSAPGSASLAKVNQVFGPLETLGKLGNLGMRAISNIAGGMADARTVTGQSFGEAFTGIIADTAREIPEGARKQFYKEAGDFVQVMQSQMRARVLDGSPIRGGLSKMAEFQLKVNGHNVMNDAMGNGIAILNQKAWATHADKAFADIPQGMQAGMLQAGIGKSEWGLFKHAVREADNGAKLVLPEAFTRDAEFPPGVIESAMKESGFKGTADVYLRGVENKLRAFLIQRADVATTAAGAREISAVQFGTQAGTMEGEMVRLFSRFKSFTAQSINISRTFLNSTPDAELLRKGIVSSAFKDNTFNKGTTAMSALGQYVVLGTALAYMGDSLIRLAAGKEVNDPRKVGTWVDAMGKSGSGGLQVDLFTGEWNKYSPLEAVAGPTYSAAGKLLVAGAQATRGEAGNAGKTLSRTIRGYVPFQQMPLVKGAMDYVQRETIDEMINPGSSEKRKLREMRAKREGN